jgi:ABC-type phosphate/phosphonate transport system ATPase subunit
MHLDDVWVDLRMAGLREAGSPLHKLDLLQSMDNRYEEQQWVSEPAPFVLEKLRGSAALIGAPGIGKTTLLKWIARRLITQPDGRFLLPFYVPLRAYSLESGDRKGLLSFALRRCGISHPHQIQRWKNVLSYLSGRPISSDSSS